VDNHSYQTITFIVYTHGVQLTHRPFRDLCAEHGIAVTHQRQILYEVMHGMEGHPSPEEVYARVREQIPSISLATVYKNIHLFVASGVLREVSLHHGSIRVEMNDEAHHHMVCSQCKAIADIGEQELGLETKRRTLPGGFLVERFSVDVIGICAKCQQEAQQN
jgi:Fur family peroxide stress response transcriptional regulator